MPDISYAELLDFDLPEEDEEEDEGICRWCNGSGEHYSDPRWKCPKC